MIACEFIGLRAPSSSPFKNPIQTFKCFHFHWPVSFLNKENCVYGKKEKILIVVCMFKEYLQKLPLASHKKKRR